METEKAHAIKALGVIIGTRHNAFFKLTRQAYLSNSSKLPIKLTRCTNLPVVQDNQICTLKGSLLTLKYLEVLDLSNNTLRDLDKVVATLSKLHYLRNLNLTVRCDVGVGVCGGGGGACRGERLGVWARVVGVGEVCGGGVCKGEGLGGVRVWVWICGCACMTCYI